MSLIEFIRFIRRHIYFLTLFPLALAVWVTVLTSNSPEEYFSKTMVYTGLASGYTLESGEDQRIDYFAVNNAFDNLLNLINGRETREDVAMRLLAQHLMLAEPEPEIISATSFAALQDIFPEAARKDVVVRESLEQTLDNLKRGEAQLLVQDVVNASGGFYSLEELSKIRVSRKSNSDMIEISYETTDPGICQNTLSILTDVFIARHKKLKESETGTVMNYFIRETRRVKNDLDNIENNLRDFRHKNRIINYYEQTKTIANHKSNIEGEIQQEKMRRSAAEVLLVKLEDKLGIQGAITLRSRSIIEKRKKLGALISRITLLEFKQNKEREIASLQEKAEKMRKQLRNDIETLYQARNSIEGMPRKQVLDKWLTRFLQVSESNARLEILEKRLKEYEKNYDLFSQLGSELSRFEREVGVKEKEYLELLHSLNLSKLRQRNIEISSTLNVIDPPYFPKKPQPSKRFRLIFLALFGTGFMALAALLLIEYFDSTIKTPERAKNILGLSLIGALPLRTHKVNQVVYKRLRRRLIAYILRNLRFHIGTTKKEGRPTVLAVISTMRGEGKSIVLKMLAGKLHSLGNKVFVLKPDLGTRGEADPGKEQAPQGIQQTSFGPALHYAVNADFFQFNHVASLLKDTALNYQDFDYILVEMPALLTHEIPLGLIKQAHLSILVTQANRVWQQSDMSILRDYIKQTGISPLCLLNGVKMDRLEGLVGEMPLRRSFLRKAIKQIAKLEFRS